MPVCTKRRYHDRQAAKKAIKWFKTRGLIFKFTPYKCDKCHGFHLTHHSSVSKRAIRELIDTFQVGQVWRVIGTDIEFEVVSPPANGTGLHLLMNQVELIR